MAVDMNEILSKKEFDNVDSNLKKELVSLSVKLDGKSQMEVTKAIIDFYNRNIKGSKLAPHEEKAMFTAITSSLADKDRKIFESMYSMLQKNK